MAQNCTSSMFRRDTMHTQRLRLWTMSQNQTNSRKIICVFSIRGTMFWKYIYPYTNSKLNSTPLQNVSLHAHQHGYHPVPINFFMIVNAKVLSKAGFTEIVSVIILNLNFLSRKTWKTPFWEQRDFTNLTNQGHQYKSFQGYQKTLFQFIQRMNSNLQSINHFNLRLVSEYEQLWFAIDLYW